MTTSDDHHLDGLRRAWERRARSPLCPFLVASDPDYHDPEAGRAQALIDLRGLFLGYAPERLATLHVLEVGCGAGRLAHELAPRVKSYAGFDISPTMVAAARERCAEVQDARFFVGDGAGPPSELRAARFEFVFSWAVMIHVPRDVAIQNLHAAWERVAPGGELRFQFRADASEVDGLGALPADLVDLGAFVPPPPRVVRYEEDDVRRAELDLLLERRAGEPAYMGHAFGFTELAREVKALGGSASRVVRIDADVHYVLVKRQPV